MVKREEKYIWVSGQQSAAQPKIPAVIRTVEVKESQERECILKHHGENLPEVKLHENQTNGVINLLFRKEHNMESLTYIKNLRISPKKMRFLLDEVKKQSPTNVMDYLYYSPKKPAKVFYKVLKSALANAKNTLKIDETKLRFKLLTVEEGQKLKRYRSGGRGTVKSIMKRYSHVKVILEENKQAQPATSKKTEIKKLPVVKAEVKKSEPKKEVAPKKQKLSVTKKKK